MKPILKQALEATCVAVTTVLSMRFISDNPPMATGEFLLVFIPTFLVAFLLLALLSKQRSQRGAAHTRPERQ